MDILTAHDFRQLAQITESSCASLLMPTHKTGREVKQDPIRFKNLLNEIERQLIDRGQRPVDAREQLAPLRQLCHDGAFWAHQDEGLAAYGTPNETRVYALPFSPHEFAVVGCRYYLVPLVSIASEDARFYVLAISPKRVRLLSGTRQTVRELDLPGWPEDFAELIAYIEEEPQLQFHTGAPPTGRDGERAAMFHGHPGGDESSRHKQRLLEFCRLIDQRLQKAVGTDQAPMVLACDAPLAAIYREASDYPHLIEQPVPGNPDSCKPAELCRKAWEIIAPDIDTARRSAL